jgi:hypothetical protein
VTGVMSPAASTYRRRRIVLVDVDCMTDVVRSLVVVVVVVGATLVAGASVVLAVRSTLVVVDASTDVGARVDVSLTLDVVSAIVVVRTVESVVGDSTLVDGGASVGAGVGMPLDVVGSTLVGGGGGGGGGGGMVGIGVLSVVVSDVLSCGGGGQPTRERTIPNHTHRRTHAAHQRHQYASWQGLTTSRTPAQPTHSATTPITSFVSAHDANATNGEPLTGTLSTLMLSCIEPDFVYLAHDTRPQTSSTSHHHPLVVRDSVQARAAVRHSRMRVRHR